MRYCEGVRSRGMKSMRALCLLALMCCIGCRDRGPPLEDRRLGVEIPVAPPAEHEPALGHLEDRPLGSVIHFSAIHYANGKDEPRELIIRGISDGPGQLELNPNHLKVDADGKIVESTLMGFQPIAVQIKPVDIPDPESKGRKVYDMVPDKGDFNRKFSIVLSPNEAGPHLLMIREGDRLLGTYNLVDPGRRA